MTAKVNEIKISYCEKLGAIHSPRVTSSHEAAKVLLDNWNRDSIAVKETFKVLLLNNSNRLKGAFQVSDGGITGTLVDLRILFAVVLKTLSVGIILAHNHPSGNLKPSQQDRQLTEKIRKAAELFDIKVLDHLIIVPEGGYFSFADDGLL
ncbi:JAB domain-containing protein [Flagellimonas olearia]|uniref:DNA repair protein n=1 Tax=Flagellimonas olearia TaxID=552546 RepID=A0A444VI26_9FLAO|nr:JAB domain-containing protein [Allomuricauda olearia]RYC50416.1 DNA repair protein [Allomuricauda olearia]